MCQTWMNIKKKFKLLTSSTKGLTEHNMLNRTRWGKNYPSLNNHLQNKLRKTKKVLRSYLTIYVWSYIVALNNRCTVTTVRQALKQTGRAKTFHLYGLRHHKAFLPRVLNLCTDPQTSTYPNSNIKRRRVVIRRVFHECKQLLTR